VEKIFCRNFFAGFRKVAEKEKKIDISCHTVSLAFSLEIQNWQALIANNKFDFRYKLEKIR